MYSVPWAMYSGTAQVRYVITTLHIAALFTVCFGSHIIHYIVYDFLCAWPVEHMNRCEIDYPYQNAEVNILYTCVLLQVFNLVL